MAENEEKTVVKSETKKNERLAEFDEFYASKLKPRLLDRYKDEVECIRKTIERFDRMLDYNVPHGKKNRGLCVYESYLGLLDKNSTNCPDDLVSRESRIEQAKALGWCIEFLQASFLVADDIMDNSTFRRGNPCWYLYENTGNIAINDSFFLLGSVYDIINEYLPKHPMYPRFYELFSHTITSTVVGQGLDLITPPKFNNDSLCDFTNYTQQQYDSIVKWKTAFYSFCLPVRAALYLACIDDREVHDKCNRILFDMGHFFQIQDDYLDCFGDPQIMGKVGTDIEECKCSWLVVQALKKCSHQQRETLEKCYGRQDHSKVASVKKIYQDLNLQGDYEKFENEAFERISKDISNLTFDTSKLDADKTKLIRDILNGYFKKIFKRNK